MDKFIVESLKRYVGNGTPPGGFLTAVLKNDLMGSFSRADDNNLQIMHDIVKYVYNKIPSISWGSPEIVDKWIKQGGLDGQRHSDMPV